jgi:hypothetical protein
LVQWFFGFYSGDEMTQDGCIKLDVNMKDEASLTWKRFSDVTQIKLMNADVNLTLDLGPDIVRQLMQALSWEGSLSRPRNLKQVHK